MLLYIAGTYRGNVRANIAAARKVAIEVWEAGHVALCPHLNTAHFEQDCACTDEDYLTGDLVLLSRCDAPLMLPGWEESAGARAEHAFALDWAMPIYYYPDIPPRGTIIVSAWPTRIIPEEPRQYHGFTPNQQAIATRIARGQSTEDITKTLGITKSTFKNHLYMIFRRLGGPKNRTALAMWVWQYHPEWIARAEAPEEGKPA